MHLYVSYPELEAIRSTIHPNIAYKHGRSGPALKLFLESKEGRRVYN